MNWQNMLMRLAMHVAKGGMRNLSRAVPSEPLSRGEPEPPTPTAPDELRLHMLSADFDSAAAAQAFCYTPLAPDGPTGLNRDLEGAMIDMAEVEVVTGDIAARLREFLDDPTADDVLLRMSGDNTLIIITEDAFGGLAYDLDDTDTLTYLGPVLVHV